MGSCCVHMAIQSYIDKCPPPGPIPANCPKVKFELLSHPGQGITKRYGGAAYKKHWHWAGIGPSAHAMRLYIDGEFIRCADDTTLGLDVAYGKYHHGNHVNFFFLHRGDNMKFKVCNDGTISCKQASHMVLGIHGDKLVIVNRGDNSQLVVRVVPDGEVCQMADVRCAQCGMHVEANAKFCSSCGAPQSINRCPECGLTVKHGANFCSKCGTSVRSGIPASAPPKYGQAAWGEKGTF